MYIGFLEKASLKIYAKIGFDHFLCVLALSTLVLAGNNPFSTKKHHPK